jgi:hypothetical protein
MGSSGMTGHKAFPGSASDGGGGDGAVASGVDDGRCSCAMLVAAAPSVSTPVAQNVMRIDLMWMSFLV